MPAQKRSLPDDDGDNPSPSPPPPASAEAEEGEEDGGEQQQQKQQQLQPPADQQQAELPKEEEEDSEDEDGGGSGGEKDEFVFVKLADIRKEVQCPICLGIIRKTRTVMECLHRFCRECIDKSMRLGNNECPACRTHCASRRSLRDDPNYDALIAALYPDIDKYEEEELAFHEEEKNRNKKIQASIAETFRRQTEALGRRRTTAKATAAAFVRKSQYRSSHGQNSYLRGRGRSSARDISLAGSEDEEEDDANGIDGKESSSADEPSPDRRQKRCRRWPAPRSSPARTAGNADNGGEENDDVEPSRDNRGTSPLQVGNREMLVWGRGGVRSQTRHGNSSGASGRFVKGGRITKLVEYIRNLDENDNEYDVHLTLLPMDEKSVPGIQRPYICCRPSLSIRHLCQFIALQMSVNAEEVEIFARKPQGGCLELKPATPVFKAESDPLKELQIVGAQESLAGLRDYFTNSRGDLVLVYRLKMQS